MKDRFPGTFTVSFQFLDFYLCVILFKCFFRTSRAAVLFVGHSYLYIYIITSLSEKLLIESKYDHVINPRDSSFRLRVEVNSNKTLKLLTYLVFPHRIQIWMKEEKRNSEQICDIFIFFYVTANTNTKQANASFPPAGYKKIQHFKIRKH